MTDTLFGLCRCKFTLDDLGILADYRDWSGTKVLERGGSPLFLTSLSTDFVVSIVAAAQVCGFLDDTSLGVEYKRSTCF